MWNNSAGFLMNAFEAELPEDPKLIPRISRPPLSTIDEDKEAKSIMEEAMRASSQAAGHVSSTRPWLAGSTSVLVSR